MLTRPHTTNCVECGKPWGSPDFGYHAGRIENGPAYWSDRGLLCSPVCSIDHYRRRLQAGEMIGPPAPNPLELIGARSG